jgi:hypothetical protein
MYTKLVKGVMNPASGFPGVEERLREQRSNKEINSPSLTAPEVEERLREQSDALTARLDLICG